MPLDWMIENRSIPLEVTDVLQELADKYRYSVDQMHQHRDSVVRELKEQGKGYLVRFLFPNGRHDQERWIHALIRMEIRRISK
jgi:hypothetical protein